MPVFLMKNVINNELNIENLIGNLQKNEKIIKIQSVNSYDEDLCVYSFTKKGMVKKTSLKEFEGNYSSQVCYKFKFEDDEVVSTDVNESKRGYLVIITKKGMGIRFPVENVNNMGKVASGVTGISLRDEDEVIFGKFTSSFLSEQDSDTEKLIVNNPSITLTSKSKEKSTIKVDEIKLQNRAGRGNSIMILVLEDEIKDVSLS